MQDHINQFPVMLQLKIAQVSREGGKILFPQGQSKVLNRAEWMLLKEIYKASLYRRLGSGKNIGKTKWKAQVAPAGPAGGPDVCGSSGTSVHGFTSL